MIKDYCCPVCLLRKLPARPKPLSISRKDQSWICGDVIIRRIDQLSHPFGHPFAISSPVSHDHRRTLLEYLKGERPQNVLPVIDLCECSVSMPHLDGRPLQDWGLGPDADNLLHPSQRHVSWPSATLERLLAELADGLHSLHRLDIAHGDPAIMNAFAERVNSGYRGVWVDLGSIRTGAEAKIIDVAGFALLTLLPALIGSQTYSLSLIEDIFVALSVGDPLVLVAAALRKERVDHISGDARSAIATSMGPILESTTPYAAQFRKMSGLLGPTFFLEYLRADLNSRFHTTVLKVERQRATLLEEERIRLHYLRFEQSLNDRKVQVEELTKALEWQSTQTFNWEAAHAESKIQTVQLEKHLGQLQADLEETHQSLEAERTLTTQLQADLEETHQSLEVERTLTAQLQADLEETHQSLEAERTLTAQLQADLEEAANQIVGLKSSLATMALDMRTNLEQMVVAMSAGNVAAQERVVAEQELDTIRNSTAWKLTYPMRRIGTKHPWLAHTGRKAAKLVWWTAQFKLFSKIKETRARRRAADDAGQKPPQLRFVEKGGTTPSPSIEPAPDKASSNATWPMDRPLLSIVIPCFNYGHFVGEAINSVLAQTFQDIEIIVVEGGSTAIESRRAVAGLSGQKVRILLQGEANLAGANRNFGIANARGKYVCCLDADDKLHPTYLEKAVFLMEHYGYDVVSTALQFFGNRQERVDILEKPELETMLQGNHMLTCAVFRHDLWQKAGGFRDVDRTVTGHVHEDWAFWIRLSALGARFWNIRGEALFLYRSHGASLSTAADVVSMDRQNVLVREMNSDVLGEKAIARSKALAAENRFERPPLRALAARSGSTSKTPVLLLAMPFLLLGGAERLLSSITGHLAQKGWRVIIVTSVPAGPEHGDTTPWFETSTAEIYHLPRFLPGDHGRARWDDFVRYLFATRSIDALLVAGSAYFYELLPGLRAEHPSLAIVDLLFNTVGHTANNRRYAEQIDLNLTESQEVTNWLLASGEALSRIRVVPSGVDLDRYCPGPKSQDVLKQIGAAPDDFIVGFSGRWSEEKNPLAFIEIAHRLASVDRIKFVMTGTGHLRGAIEQALAERPLPVGRFHLVGEVEQVQPYLQSYDVLVLPSILDGRPVVVLEALAMGVPVIASHVGALPELVEDGHNGYLCTPGKVKEFAMRLQELASAPARLAVMKEAARNFATSNLDARTMQTAYESALLHAITLSSKKNS